jgi:alpha-L-rhamnosidase
MRGLLSLRRSTAVLLVAASLAARSPARPPGVPEGEETRWAAEWITAPGAAERDRVVLHFRKAIDLPGRPAEFVVQVSADNQFILYANGREAGRGPSRADLGHWRYATYDLAPLLHPGRNVLAATVWHFGTHAAIAQMSERAGFLVHGRTAAERAADTNSSWEVEEEKGIETLKPRVRGYYAAEPGERIDGGKFDWSWQSAEESRGGWTRAVTLGRGARRGEQDAPNNWQLVADPLPPMERTEVPAGKLVRATGMAAPEGFPRSGFSVPAHTRASVLLDNGQLTTGFPVLTLRGGEGASLRATYAEALVDAKGEKGNRNEVQGRHIEGVTDEFLAGGGAAPREFSPLGWRTWRYLELEIETQGSPLAVEGLRTWFTAYPFAEQGYFRSDDPSLEPIWTIGWRTARLDAHDTFMDTPYWERLQYIGDTRIQALLSYAVAGDDRLARQAIQAFDDSRIPDGLTQSRYPSSLVQMIPTFSLMWVGMVRDFSMYRGDAEFVKGQIPGTRAALGWFLARQRPDGLLGKIPWWPFVDWGADFRDGVPPEEADGGSAVITLQFIEALGYGAELERAYGDAHNAENYEKAAQRAREAVRRLCWSEPQGLFADTPARKHFSQHANLLAVWLDVVPASEQRKVLTRILAASDAGFPDGRLPPMTRATYYFRFYLARALEHAGMGDDYLKLLGPWREMTALGLSTWAESPEPTRSDSHAWSSHPNYDFLTLVAGIRPKTPGFRTVAIEPHLGPLRRVEAGLPTPRGGIEVEFERAGTAIRARVKLPEGVSGTLTENGREYPLRPGEQRLELR